MFKHSIIILFLSFFLASAAQAKTNLPLPRYVTVKSNEANVRNGPGLQYKIKWVMVRKNMPIEVIAEYDQWRKVRDIQGDEGWMHRSQLTNRRTAIITGDTQMMHERADSSSDPVARIELGASAELLECTTTMCRLKADGNKGWVPRNTLWGVYPDETVE